MLSLSDSFLNKGRLHNGESDNLEVIRVGDSIWIAPSPSRAPNPWHVGQLLGLDGGHGVGGGHPAVLCHRIWGIALLASALNVLPEHVSQPQQRRGEEQEPGGEAIMEAKPDIVNLDCIVLAKLEEAWETNYCR